MSGIDIDFTMIIEITFQRLLEKRNELQMKERSMGMIHQSLSSISFEKDFTWCTSNGTKVRIDGRCSTYSTSGWNGFQLSFHFHFTAREFYEEQ